MGKYALFGKGRGSSSRTHYRRIKKAVDAHLMSLRPLNVPSDAGNHVDAKAIEFSEQFNSCNVMQSYFCNTTDIPVTEIVTCCRHRLIRVSESEIGMSQFVQETDTSNNDNLLCSSNSMNNPVDSSYIDPVDEAAGVSASNTLSDNDESCHSPPVLQRAPVLVTPPEVHFDLQSFLREWTIVNNISHIALNQLLKGLNKYDATLSLPSDARTLLKTPRTVNVRQMGHGEYIYFGLKESLLKKIKQLQIYAFKCLTLDFNIDGIPLFKSSRTEFWPILCSIEEAYDKGLLPFPIAIFCGNTKPPIDEFFNDFIEDLTDVLQNGLTCNETHYTYPVNLRAFIADAPAKAYMRCVKLHSGYYGCDKCTTVGMYYGRVTFPEIDADLRLDESFSLCEDTNFHIGKTPLANLNVGLISLFPIDYMHQVCLGVMKRMLQFWVRGMKGVKLNTARLSHSFQSVISKFLTNARQIWPSDFTRQPRGLNDLDRWKATELRQFLLYLAPVCLKRLHSNEVYNHFMLLHCAIRILVGEKCKDLNALADQMLRAFVTHSAAYYGNEFIVYNVHMLIHLAKDVLKYGSLDSFSSFKYENQLGLIKRELRSKSKPLQQLCKRLGEQAQHIDSGVSNLRPIAVQSFIPTHVHSEGPTAGLHGTQYSKLTGPTFQLSTHPRNRNVILKDGSVFQIQNFVVLECDTDDIRIIGFRFTKYIDFYDYPIKSSDLQVYFVEKLARELSVISFQCVWKKAVLLPCQHGFCTVEIQGKNGIELFAVPESWLFIDGNKQFVRFPFYLSTSRCELAARMKESCTDRWKTYAAEVVGRNMTYKVAKQQVEQMSDGNDTETIHKHPAPSVSSQPNCVKALPTFNNVGLQLKKNFPKGYTSNKFGRNSRAIQLSKTNKLKGKYFQNKAVRPKQSRPTGNEPVKIPLLPKETNQHCNEAITSNSATPRQSSNTDVLPSHNAWPEYSNSSLQYTPPSHYTSYNALPPYQPPLMNNSITAFPNNSNITPAIGLQQSFSQPQSNTHNLQEYEPQRVLTQLQTYSLQQLPSTSANNDVYGNSCSQQQDSTFTIAAVTTNAESIAKDSNRCCCDPGFQRKVLEHMEFMRRQLLHLTQAMVPNINVNASTNFAHDLPLRLEEHIWALEEHTSNVENLTLMCKSVGLVGGIDVKECVRRVMCQLIHYELARKVNWAGTNKLALKNFKNVVQTIKGAVRCNTAFNKATDCEIEDAIKKWLRGSIDRGAGARKRTTIPCAPYVNL